MDSPRCIRARCDSCCMQRCGVRLALKKVERGEKDEEDLGVK
jgi:hypothetical protein